MKGYTFVSESTVSNGAVVKHYVQDISLSLRESLDIQRKSLDQFVCHPAYDRIKADTKANTFVDGLDLDEPMNMVEVNRLVPRGGAIEEIAKKYTPIEYWEPSEKTLSQVSMSVVANTLNRDLPAFNGDLYVTYGDGSKPRFDIGYRRNDLPVEQQQAAMDAVFAYFKGLGYKTARERSNYRAVKQVWVYL